MSEMNEWMYVLNAARHDDEYMNEWMSGMNEWMYVLNAARHDDEYMNE